MISLTFPFSSLIICNAPSHSLGGASVWTETDYGLSDGFEFVRAVSLMRPMKAIGA